MKRRSILLLFPFEWIAYSTPLHNLVDAMRAHFDVTVLSIETDQFRRGTLDETVYQSIKVDETLVGPLVRAFTRLLNRYKWPHTSFSSAKVSKMMRIAAEISRRRPDIVIATDSLGLLLASHVFRPVIYYSLELCRDEYLALSDITSISCVVTQTEQRRRYLFGEKKMETYCIPNSPRFSAGLSGAAGSRPFVSGRRMVYFGNVAVTHGMALLPSILEYLDANDSMTLSGIITAEARQWISQNYKALLENGRLVIDDAYVDAAFVSDYLSHFSIGICVYDFAALQRKMFSECSSFERPSIDDRELRSLYTTTKLFNYLAAGVPVVGLDIACMRPVHDFNCGILLDELRPRRIAEAVVRIDRDRERYVAGCYRAAEAFDFDDHVGPLIKFFGSSRALSRKIAGNSAMAVFRLAFDLVFRLRRKRARMLKKIRERIHDLKGQLGNAPVVVYGGGDHTAYLSKHGYMEGFNVIAVVDGNPALWGRWACGVSVGPPDEAILAHQRILISSYGSQEAIEKTIRERSLPGVSLWTLYPNQG